jgi:CDP-paratose 2-epimerase
MAPAPRRLMRVLVTGVCGFAGSSIVRHLREARHGVEILGIDNFARPGSEVNRAALRKLGVKVVQGDARLASDFETLPPVDWVIDAAANPSVLAGLQGPVSPRQVLEHNLIGTVNVLEHCRRHGAGLVLLSTSRVYSVGDLLRLPLETRDQAFALAKQCLPIGTSARGVTEEFPTSPPLSLYGSTKRASEMLAIEYAASFAVPVRIVRCGVLAGAGQFGRPDQGIFSFWVHAWRQGRPLRYIGFGGRGRQVRDCLHPRDLTRLLLTMTDCPGVLAEGDALCNASGGADNAMSLAELSAWCADRLGPREVGFDPADRPMDVPWLVLDSGRTQARWGWSPQTPIDSVLDEIAAFARAHPDWLELSEA